MPNSYPTDGLAIAKSARPAMMLNNSARPINTLSLVNKFIGHVICPDLQVNDRFGTYPQFDLAEYWSAVGPSRLERGASAPEDEMTFTEAQFQIHRKVCMTNPGGSCKRRIHPD